MKNSIGLVALALTMFLGACADAPVGTKKRPFTMYFIPSVDAEKIAHTAKSLTDYVSKSVSQKLYGKDKGFYVKSAIPTSYIAVVEALGTKRADFAAFTTFAYILARDIKKYDVEAVLTILRNKGETTYKAQILAHVDSGIKTLEDLKGKRFAYTDPASTSGYILPSRLIKSKNIELGKTVFAHKHDNVVTMIYQRQVDAGATYYSMPRVTIKNGKKVTEITDARARVKTQFPDVEDKIKIIAFTQDIPNEPWVIRTNLYKDPAQTTKVKEAVIEALLAFVKTEEGKEMLQILSTGTGLIPVDDSVYDDIRKIVTNTDLNIENLLNKKKNKKKG